MFLWQGQWRPYHELEKMAVSRVFGDQTVLTGADSVSLLNGVSEFKIWPDEVKLRGA